MPNEHKSHQELDHGKAFSEALAEQQQQRDQASEAFAAEQRRPPTSRDLLAEQVKHSQQVERLTREIDRVRRQVLLTNSLIILILGLIVALPMIAFLNPHLTAQFITQPIITQPNVITEPNTSQSDPTPLSPSSLPGTQPSANARASNQDFNLRKESPLMVENETDEEHRKLLRDLLDRLLQIRAPIGSSEDRYASNDHYVQFIDDVLVTIERATAADASLEIIRALANLAEVGKAMRMVNQIDQLDSEMKDKLDQIRAVARTTQHHFRN